MLHDKDIKNLSELKSTFIAQHKEEQFFSDLIDSLKLGKHHAIFSNVKQKGILVITLIKIMLSFAFIGENSIFSLPPLFRICNPKILISCIIIFLSDYKSERAGE